MRGPFLDIGGPSADVLTISSSVRQRRELSLFCKKIFIDFDEL
jgi:hypothetical protein